jgi:hypothetical protein
VFRNRSEFNLVGATHSNDIMGLIKSFQCKDLLHKHDKSHTLSTGQVQYLAVLSREKQVELAFLI